MRRLPRVCALVLSLSALLAPSANALSFFDTGVIGGAPSSSLLGVNLTSADAGSSFDLDWSVSLGGDTLSASATFDIVSLSATSLVLGVSITNTTLLSATLTNADILSMGFGVAPNASASLSSAGSVFDVVGTGSGPNQTFPGGFKNIDVCVFGQGCSGGAVAEGLHAGDSDQFELSLTGNFAAGSVDLLYFPLKFQTSQGSFEPGGSLIPEPSSAVLFAVGVLLTGSALRRRPLRG